LGPIKKRQEAFALAVADGVAPRQAYADVGYKSPQNAGTRSERLLVILAPRIEAIRQKRVDELRDPRLVIERLLALAERAIEDKSLAALNTARALLAEAGKLKAKVADPRPLRLPSDAISPEAPDEPEVEPPLDHEAWIARYAPRSA
jgi:hypothetical protein